ncbi:hypothetical protein QBC39DRAFT_374367 [Podospora conica]|nr:hypothetical protein QBC39DRAFT_374367 [Schizothecium conicum]
MPYSQADAPPNIPDAELIESLLCERTKRKQARPLQELTEAERNKTNLVQFGKRQTHIEGDPFGVWCAWAGNVCHQEDDRMVDVLGPVLDAITAAKAQDNEDVASLRQLLDRMPNSDICLLANELADDHNPIMDRSDRTQITATFRHASRTVRLIQCLDLDVMDKQTFSTSARAQRHAELAEEQVGEAQMPVAVQQYLMAGILAERQDEFSAAIDNETATMTKTGEHTRNGKLATLRSLAREKYWLDMSKAERAEAREKADSQEVEANLEASLATVKANWNAKWNNGHYDPDYFRNYLADQTAAAELWTLVEEDIFIVTDKHRRVVFANIEKLSQILFGDEVTQLIDRAIDLWSFYHPLPRPETSRHVVDRYVRRKHPELDPSKCTVETLQNAKMAVAHYGCWSRKGDPHGKFICATMDTRGLKTHSPELFSIMFRRFARAVLGKTSELIRFLARPLDENYYKECVEIFENLPDISRLSVDDKEDWISLFALGINGYTQRHTDIRDIQGGLAGLFTVGRYTGANLCLPQLGVKVPYVSQTIHRV